MDDGGAESGDDNNDQASFNPSCRLCRPRGRKFGHGPEGSEGPMGPMAPIFMNVHVSWPVFSTMDDEDVESHILCTNVWMNSQHIAENANYGSCCLTSGGDAWL